MLLIDVLYPRCSKCGPAQFAVDQNARPGVPDRIQMASYCHPHGHPILAKALS